MSTPEQSGRSPNKSQALSVLSGGGPAPGSGEIGGGGYPFQGDFGILWFLGNKSLSLLSVKNITIPPHGLKQVNLVKNI